MPYPYDEGPGHRLDEGCIGPFSKSITLGAATRESSLTEDSLDILDKELSSISDKIVALRNKLRIITTSSDNEPLQSPTNAQIEKQKQIITPATTLHGKLRDIYNRAVGVSQSLQSLINHIQL